MMKEGMIRTTPETLEALGLVRVLDAVDEMVEAVTSQC